MNGVALCKATLDGALGLGASLATLFTDTATCDIPVLSTLWRMLTGSALTFLDLFSFVAAIPVTLLYRVVEGAWPEAAASPAALGAGAPSLKKVASDLGGVMLVLLGIVTAVNDALATVAAPGVDPDGGVPATPDAGATLDTAKLLGQVAFAIVILVQVALDVVQEIGGTISSASRCGSTSSGRRARPIPS